MVNKFKEELDKARGLIILITNHKESVDNSVLRDGRVNEFIDMGRNFYSLEEKKCIMNYYKNKYNINDFDVPDDIIRDILVSSIPSICEKEMLDRGIKEINLNSVKK